MQKRIGLYGGTFDPVHSGHVSLAQSFLKSDKIDELWIILTPFPPHKQKIHPSSFFHRHNMLQLAFKQIEKVQISTIEEGLPKPSYTFQTIEYVIDSYRDTNFFYCLGGDSLIKFHTWKYPEKILKHVELLVAGRPGIDYSDIGSVILEKSKFVDHQPINVSSTQIKSLVARNKSINGLVDEKVESYIRTHKLYLTD